VRVTPTCDPADTFFISQAANVQFSPDISYGGGQYMVVWVDGKTNQHNYYAAVAARGNRINNLLFNREKYLMSINLISLFG